MNMPRIGILMHVYHLESRDWERLVWGDPSEDKLGTATQFVKTLLDIPVDQEVVSVIFNGPSTKDGLTEGAFTKQYLLDRISTLREFRSLRPRLDRLTAQEHTILLDRLQGIIVGPVIKNTFEEVEHGATLLNQGRVADNVLQIAAASHAPRCLQYQIIARRNGVIPKSQPWYILPSETCFSGTEMEDVVILEPPNRGDDPMLQYGQTLPAVIKPYFNLDVSGKQRLIELIRDALRATH
jgi:hypothetical protein